MPGIQTPSNPREGGTHRGRDRQNWEVGITQGRGQKAENIGKDWG